MSKNLTRKGLAFGALVALGSTVIAGTPANAAVSGLTLASAYGTSTQTILGQQFSLALSASGFATGPGTTDGVELFIEGANPAELTTTTQRNVVDLDASDAYGTPLTAVATVPAVDKTANVPALTNAAGKYTQIRLGLTGVTSTRTIKVTPFVDSVIDNGKIDAGETLKGNTVEITFNKASEVTATTVHKAPAIGDAKLEQKAVITLDKGINLEQMRDSATSLVTVDFKVNGSDADFYDTDANFADELAVYSKTEGGLYKAAKESADSTNFAIAKNRVYSAQAKIDGTASGTLATATVSAGATNVANVTTAGTKDVNDAGFVGATVNTNVRKNADNSYSVRTGTTAVSVVSGVVNKLDDDGAQISVGAGVAAKVKITKTTLASGSTVVAGGKTLTSSDADTSFNTTTNADGKVAFDLTATGAAADKVSIVVSVLDEEVWVAATATTLEWADASVANSVPVLTDMVGDSNSASTAILGVKAGSSYTLNFALFDDFGALYSGSSSRYVHVTGGSVAKFVGGKASVVRTNAATGDALAETLDFGLSSSDTFAAPASTYSVDVIAKSNVTPGFLTAINTTTPTISSATFAAGDARDGSALTAWSPTDLGTATVVSGTLLNSSGVALPGTPVTISGTGLLFSAGYFADASQKVWAKDSIVVYTDAAGAYAVDVYSNKAGEQAVKVTAGTVTATTTPDWTDAAATAGSTLAITAPTSAAPGTTVAVVVTLTDKKGNAVKTDGATGISFSVRVEGAGSAGTINQFTDSNGQTKFNVVIGSGETGSFKVIAKYDADAATTAKAGIVKEATVTVAAVAPVVVEPVSKIGTANGRVYVNVKDAKGAVVSVKIGSKWTTKTSLNNDYTFSFKNTKGKKVAVKVYVDGDLSAAKTITVK